MKCIDPRILRMIRRHHVLSLAVTADDQPWCASCFYCYLPAKNLFVFTSDPDTRHIRDFLASPRPCVAGTIALETKIIGKIRGIQFAGTMRKLRDEEEVIARKAYLARFPFARFTELHLWGVEPDLLKLTDNRLGFGKKLIWTMEM